LGDAWLLMVRPNSTARIAEMSFDKKELKALWWLIKWGLFWILVLLVFGIPAFVFF
jgi:hypothetical protein